VLPYFFFWASNCIYALSVLVVECYNTRSDKWMICSGLNHEKGTLASVICNGKIYVLDGDETQTYSEVEMFNPFLGK
jgi:hypothetical protein